MASSRVAALRSGMHKRRMLSRALPVDVVIMIGDHVRELAAIVLQKFMRGAAVRRLAWGLPGLCDADGNLVYL